MLADVLACHREAIDQRRIRLATNARYTPLTAPAGVIDCVVRNLIANAVRHTRDAAIVIDVTPDPNRIADQGSGVSEAAREHIFKREYRTNDSPGLGIGLCLVSRICQRMGWSIDTDSAPGQGTLIEIGLRPTRSLA